METGKALNLERRQFPRTEDNIFIFVTLSSSSTNLKINTPGGFKAFAKSISAGGLMFETEENIIERDNELELEIYQPVNPDKTMIFSLPVLAKVIWIQKIEKEHFENGENKYLIGVKFLHIKEQDRQKIVKYADEIQRSKYNYKMN